MGTEASEAVLTLNYELLLKYELVGVMGKGTYGKVYKANKLDAMGSVIKGGSIAIKTFNPGNNKNRMSISTLREISILREMNHPNVVNLIDVVIDTEKCDLALVMDFCEWTLEHIRNTHFSKKDPISERSRVAMMYQCLKGLEYMHENWVLHRDLKPQNILIVGDQASPNYGALQLADLGLARVFREPLAALGDVDRTVVTLWYRAPELLLGAKHYTTAVDVWSLGCIFAELFYAHQTDKALFRGAQQDPNKKQKLEVDQCKQIFKVLGMPNPSTWKEVLDLPWYEDLTKAKELQNLQVVGLATLLKKYENNANASGFSDLLAKMLELDPSKRISAKEALEHQYIKRWSERESLKNALYDQNRPNALSYYPTTRPEPLSQEERKLIEQAKGAKRGADAAPPPYKRPRLAN